MKKMKIKKMTNRDDFLEGDDFLDIGDEPEYVELTTSQFQLRVTIEQMKNIQAMYAISEDNNCEMLALGEVENDNGIFTLKEFYVPKQKSNGTACDVDREAIAQIIFEEKKVNFWLHTHPSMSAFWSPTDDDTARRLCGTETEYIISLVIGQGNETKARLDFSKPVELKIDISIEIDYNPDNDILKKWKETFRKKVKKTRTPTYQIPGLHANPNLGSYGKFKQKHFDPYPDFPSLGEFDKPNSKKKGKKNGSKKTIKTR